jgi:hypothetical protein
VACQGLEALPVAEAVIRNSRVAASPAAIVGHSKSFDAYLSESRMSCKANGKLEFEPHDFCWLVRVFLNALVALDKERPADRQGFEGVHFPPKASSFNLRFREAGKFVQYLLQPEFA